MTLYLAMNKKVQISVNKIGMFKVTIAQNVYKIPFPHLHLKVLVGGLFFNQASNTHFNYI